MSAKVNGQTQRERKRERKRERERESERRESAAHERTFFTWYKNTSHG